MRKVLVLSVIALFMVVSACKVVDDQSSELMNNDDDAAAIDDLKVNDQLVQVIKQSNDTYTVSKIVNSKFVKDEKYSYRVCLFDTMKECQKNFDLEETRTTVYKKMPTLKHVKDSNPPRVEVTFTVDPQHPVISSFYILKIKNKSDGFLGFFADDPVLLRPYPAKISTSGKVLEINKPKKE